MKKYCLALLLLVASMQSAYGFNGVQKYDNETIDSVHGNGTAILNHAKILGHLQVNGSVNAEDSSINSLQVNSQTVLKKLHSYQCCDDKWRLRSHPNQISK